MNLCVVSECVTHANVLEVPLLLCICKFASQVSIFVGVKSASGGRLIVNAVWLFTVVSRCKFGFSSLEGFASRVIDWFLV